MRIRRFLADNGWEDRVKDTDRFAKMLENANRTVVAVENGEIVGFARALCDEASNGYIGTVAVSPAQRGKGIGRKLVERLMGDDPSITWVLRAARKDSVGFWKKMGFQPSVVAMELKRRVP